MDTKTSSISTNQDAPLITPIAPPAQTDEGKKWMTWALLSALISGLALLTLLFKLPQLTAPATTGGSNIGLVGQQLATNLNNVTMATDTATSQAAYDNLQKNLATMKTVVATPEAKSQAPELVNGWADNQKKIEFILNNKTQLDQMMGVVAKVNEALPNLQQQYRGVVEKMVAGKASANQVAIANNQIWLAEKISRQISDLKSAQTVDIKEIVKNIQQFGATIDGEISGTPAIEQITNPAMVQDLQAIKANYDKSLKTSIEQMEQLGDTTQQVRQQAQEVSKFATTNAKGTVAATGSMPDMTWVWLPLGLLGLGLLGGLYSAHRIRTARSLIDRTVTDRETLRQRNEIEIESERARKIQEENERNQMAILRLLDELGDLAEGDLTVNATVSEDFTGAIADSVNFAIDQLRQLVSAINVTAERVARASDQTQATAMELAEASESQAQEIAGASAAINEMAVSIDQVSSNAAESAAVADRSVAIAHNGAEVVQRTIDGMNTIRDQIQETSKRIKRLGESSQEIGDIVGLINDIADQTNILALNAAIQASMAGEAGRGFAVVADEVQRLAERSANATKQIETLVKTIQADTNEAVMSMESTTAEVVRGARLAKDAGEALEEVQTVSTNLAQLIQSISNAARQQAASAGHISNTMNIIQDITSQTTSGTMATARSVGQLNEMAAALQESVSGFKLPEEDTLR